MPGLRVCSHPEKERKKNRSKQSAKPIYTSRRSNSSIIIYVGEKERGSRDNCGREKFNGPGSLPPRFPRIIIFGKITRTFSFSFSLSLSLSHPLILARPFSFIFFRVRARARVMWAEGAIDDKAPGRQRAITMLPHYVHTWALVYVCTRVCVCVYIYAAGITLRERRKSFVRADAKCDIGVK